ncbi:MAG: YbjQ family protein [Methanomicrobiales archaeon]
MPSSVIKYLTEKRWAFVAVFLGIVVGFGSAIICLAWNLVIFGFNIMYIVSPLIAGVVETVIARRKYGRSTGAISALLTFILINAYGWLGPGYLFPREPATLSLITIIALVLMFQAAFPTLVNYILFVIVLGMISKFIGFLLYLPAKIQGKIPEAEVKEEIKGPSVDEIFLDELTIPFLTVTPSHGKIEKYLGLVTGEAVAKEKESEGLLLKLSKITQPTQLEEMNLDEARKRAISHMLESSKSIGADTVIDVIIDYTSMGGLQGSALIVTATGTAVKHV